MIEGAVAVCYGPSMRQQLRQLSGDTAIYGVTTIVQRLLSFLLTPFYSWVLAPSDFGLQANIYAIIAFMMVVANIGMEAAYFRFVASASSEDEKRRVFWNATLVNWLAAGLLATLFVAAPGAANVLFFLKVPDTALHLVQYAGVIILLDAASTIGLATLRMERRAKAFGAIKIAAIVVNVVLTIWFLASLGLGIDGILLAGIAQSATMFLLTTPVMARRLPVTLDRETTRSMLAFGLPTVASGLAAIALQVIDRPIIVALAGAEAAGLYQASYRLGIPMMMFVAMFEFAWRPFFLQQAGRENARALFARVFTYFNLAAGFVFLAVSFFVTTIAGAQLPVVDRALLDERYWAGLPIVPIVLAAYIFNGWYTNFIVGIYIEKRTRALPWITGVGALVEAGLCFALVPAMGFPGGAWATLAAYLVMSMVLWRYTSRFFTIPYEWGRVLRALGIALVLYVIGTATTDFYDLGARASLVRIGLLAAYPLLLFVTGFFEPGERRELRRIILRRS
jgi:O-antigen/teichoic acid export membrane protein